MDVSLLYLCFRVSGCRLRKVGSRRLRPGCHKLELGGVGARQETRSTSSKPSRAGPVVAAGFGSGVEVGVDDNCAGQWQGSGRRLGRRRKQ